MKSRSPYSSIFTKPAWYLFGAPGLLFRSPWLYLFTYKIFANWHEKFVKGITSSQPFFNFLKYIPVKLSKFIGEPQHIKPPIILKDSDLTQDECSQNTRYVSTLFRSSHYRFKDLLSLEYERDSDRNPKFSAAMRVAAAKIGVDPAKIKLAKIQHQTVIDAAFRKDHIVLEEPLLFSTDDAYEQRNALHHYLRAVLCMQAVEEDTQKIIASDIDEENKRYAEKICEKKLTSCQREIISFLRWHDIHEALLVAKSPGDGDCFYHSTMLGLIYDILSDQLTDASLTAQYIKLRLMPLINTKLQLLGKDAIEVSDKSIKQIIIALLETTPLIKSATCQTDDRLEIRAIKLCDMYHLLRDICAPALRELIQKDSDNHATREAVNDVLHNEFNAFIICHYGNQLGLSDDEIAVAKNQSENGELSDIPDFRKQFFISAWHTCGKQLTENVSADANANSLINEAFTSWWTNHADAAMTAYFSFHTQPHVMASKPQQIAIRNQLHCNLVNVNNHSGLLDPLTPEIPDAHTLMYKNTTLHFDAMIGDVHVTEPSKLTHALHDKMHEINLHHGELKQSTYPWPAKPNEEKITEITHENVMTSIDETLAIILAAEGDNEAIFTPLNSHSQEVLSVAKTGYQAVMAQTFFSEQDAKAKQEAEDLLLAIKLQNEEIARYVKTKNACVA